jgi:hypothetical protein
MSEQAGLLANIQAGVVDDSVSLESLLQKCIALGGQAGSVKLRDWARQELNGYSGQWEDLPSYRKVTAQLMATVANSFGVNGRPQEIYEHDVPEVIRRRRSSWGAAELCNSVGELEAIANSAETMVNLSPSWSSELVEVLNEHNGARNSLVTRVYWPISTSAFRGVLSRIRTALVELVTELADLTPEGQTVPNQDAVDGVLQFIFTGDRQHITLVRQNAGEHGTNTITGASGDRATAVGRQSVTGDNNTTAGRAVTMPAVTSTEKDGWWARLRKRGLLVAIFTVVAGVIAVLTYFGVAPSSAPPHPSAPAVPTTTSR